MYKNPKKSQQMSINFDEFFLPFGGSLDGENRWVKLAALIPWDLFEDDYAELLSSSHGAGALPFRVALGALIIKERQRITDRETVEQIKENPYLQYFLGFTEFTQEAPFDASMLVHFRKRISEELIRSINEKVIESAREKQHNASFSTPEKQNSDHEDEPPSNSGKLIIDATCTPADIRYPTDLSLLNEAREKTERIIDTLWENRPATCSIHKKPRTYRKRARKDFVTVVKQQKDRNKNSRKALRKQLGYLKRNLSHIDRLSKEVPLTTLSKFLYRSLLVVSEVYRQQYEMYTRETHRIADRIVSITQPHVRPIVRGKAGKKVEFGAKISASSCDGYGIVDRISWDAYNENEDLIVQARRYRKRFGYYPASIHADKIYRSRENRRWCKKHNIRLSGPALGRPQKVGDENNREIKRQRLLSRQDEIDRIDIEGRFGHSKRRYGLDRVMAKLTNTSTCVISLVFLVMNLEKILRDLFLRLFYPAAHLKYYYRLLGASLVRWFERVMPREPGGIMENLKLMA
jgi:IS5 family transposase